MSADLAMISPAVDWPPNCKTGHLPDSLTCRRWPGSSKHIRVCQYRASQTADRETR
jgi:hypothetical protein